MKTVRRQLKLDPTLISKRRKQITRLWNILRRDYANI